MLRIPCELQPFILDAVCPVVQRLLANDHQLVPSVFPESERDRDGFELDSVADAEAT